MIESLESFVTLYDEADLIESCRLCGKIAKEIGVPCPCRWRTWTEAVRPWEQELPVSFEDLLRDAGKEDRQIDLDIGRTFPRLNAFDAARQQSLARVLRAYVASRPDVGYCQGMNFVAGLLILASNDEEDAFRVLLRLMDTYNLAGFYRASFPLMKRYVHAADRLLFRESPKLHSHLQDQGVQPYLYMHEWFLTLFVDCVPTSLVLDIFQAITHKGLFIVVPVVVAILRGFEGALVSLRFEEIFRCLKGMKDLDKRRSNEFRLSTAVDRAVAIKIPLDILAYLNDESDEFTELPLETEVDGKGVLKAISRTMASLSPKKRRQRRALENSLQPEGPLTPAARCSLLSPKKRPSLAAKSPCDVFSPMVKPQPSLAAASPACVRPPTPRGDLSPGMSSPREESPTKCARLQSSPGREVEITASSFGLSSRSACARRRPVARPRPKPLDIEENSENKSDAIRPAMSKSSAWRAQCCSGNQRVTSPVRRSCSSSCSPSKRGCSGSPVKRLTYTGSPRKSMKS